MADSEEKYCSNCKRNIAAANFLMHEVHCKRNIVLCEHCKEPVPKSELESHFEEQHAKEDCPLCSIPVEKCQQEEHKAICPKRSVKCVYCELDLPHSDLASHQDYCGTRTEQCYRCGVYIMQKDQAKHEESKCTYPPLKVKKRQPQRYPSPPAVSCDSSDHYINSFAMGELSRILHTVPSGGPMHEQLPEPGFNPERSAPGPVERNLVWQNYQPRGTSNTGRSQNKKLGTQQNGKTKNTNHQANRTIDNLNLLEEEPDIDHLLAMHLAHDLAQDSEEPDLSAQVTRSQSSPEANHNAEDIMLPCEICGLSLPADSILLHQGMCAGEYDDLPPSLPTDRSSLSVQPEAMVLPNNSPRRQTTRSMAQPHILDNLSYLAAQDSFIDHINGDDDGIQLPCEFCEQLFPEEFLVQHQAVCDSNMTQTPRVQSPHVSIPHRIPKLSSSAVGAATTYTNPKTQQHRRQADPAVEFQNEESGASGSSSAARYSTKKTIPKMKNANFHSKVRSPVSRVPPSLYPYTRGNATVPSKDSHYNGAASSEEEEVKEDRTRCRRRGSAAKVNQTLNHLLMNPVYSTQDLLAFMEKEDEINKKACYTGEKYSQKHNEKSQLDKEMKSKSNQHKKDSSASYSLHRMGDKKKTGERPSSRTYHHPSPVLDDSSARTYDPSFAAPQRTSRSKPKGKTKSLQGQTDVGKFNIPSSVRHAQSLEQNGTKTTTTNIGSKPRRGTSHSRKYQHGDT